MQYIGTYRPIDPLSHHQDSVMVVIQPVFYLIKMPQVLPTFFFKPSSAPGWHFTSLNPSPQCLRFRPDSFPSMPCWYCISSSLLIFLSSCPTENTAVTGVTPANSGLSTHGQIWVAGVEWGGYINHQRIVSNRQQRGSISEMLHQRAHHCGGVMWTCGHRWRGGPYVPSGKQKSVR